MKTLVHVCFSSGIENGPFDEPDNCRCNSDFPGNDSIWEGKSLDSIRKKVMSKLSKCNLHTLEHIEQVMIYEIVGEPVLISFADPESSPYEDADTRERPTEIQEIFRAKYEQAEKERAKYQRERDMAELKRLREKLGV